jgi:hypothetical protein
LGPQQGPDRHRRPRPASGGHPAHLAMREISTIAPPGQTTPTRQAPGFHRPEARRRQGEPGVSGRWRVRTADLLLASDLRPESGVTRRVLGRRKGAGRRVVRVVSDGIAGRVCRWCVSLGEAVLRISRRSRNLPRARAERARQQQGERVSAERSELRSSRLDGRRVAELRERELLVGGVRP